jgi:hypothetical protein
VVSALIILNAGIMAITVMEVFEVIAVMEVFEVIAVKLSKRMTKCYLR